MINFDSFTLSALVEEIRPIVLGSRVHKVQQPSKNELILTLRTQATNKKLLISAHQQYSYIGIIDESSRRFNIPDKPPMFCMLLRKHMKGSKIVDIRQPEHERILEIDFESFNELEDKVLMTLSCEIMGKYSNIILYVADSQLILGCAHNVGELMSSKREVAGGLHYIYPPQQKKYNILEISEQDFILKSMAINESIDIWLNQNFHDISLAMAKEFCNVSNIKFKPGQGTINEVDSLKNLYSIITNQMYKKHFRPSISKDQKVFSLLALDKYSEWQEYSSINEMVVSYFDSLINNEIIYNLKQTLSTATKKEIKKIKNKVEKINQVILKAEKAEDIKNKADLLMANLYKIKPSQKNVDLENFFEANKLVSVELDPSMTPLQNAQKYYKVYHKAKNGLDYALERKVNEEAELTYLYSILSSINIANEVDILEEIKLELTENFNTKKSNNRIQKNEKKPEISRFSSSDGIEILVGKNNKQNDYLLSKLSHPKDIWVHTQIAHGSHVIIKTDLGKIAVPETTIQEACLLAGYFSEGRLSSNVNVIYTLRKFVKKPSGSKPGFVVYSNEKILYVNPLIEHVAPILERELAHS